SCYLGTERARSCGPPVVSFGERGTTGRGAPAIEKVRRAKLRVRGNGSASETRTPCGLDNEYAPGTIENKMRRVAQPAFGGKSVVLFRRLLNVPGRTETAWIVNRSKLCLRII